MANEEKEKSGKEEEIWESWFLSVKKRDDGPILIISWINEIWETSTK